MLEGQLALESEANRMGELGAVRSTSFIIARAEVHDL